MKIKKKIRELMMGMTTLRLRKRKPLPIQKLASADVISQIPIDPPIVRRPNPKKTRFCTIIFFKKIS